jgi:carboxynorspermidine decarboxylase
MKTPYYLIDESLLLKNLEKIQYIREHSYAKVLLALKCFSTWSVFPLISQYLDGTTSSSLYEARLGYEEFPGEVHAYCVGYSDSDIKEVKGYSDKIIFNSVSQLRRYCYSVEGKEIGLRINPGFSYSHFDLADPARICSRLGVTDINNPDFLQELPRISGLMFHYNCENADFDNFSKSLDRLSAEYGHIIKKVRWISLGGGIYFTQKGYPYRSLAKRLKEFTRELGVQIYLEPGEAVITGAGELVTSVVDVVHNRTNIAIVDASAEAHMLDSIIYNTGTKILSDPRGTHEYTIAGRSCLAGDIFGKGMFKKALHAGDIIRIRDAAGYSMVKTTWFNGLQKPSIVVKRLDGTLETRAVSDYNLFKSTLS